MSTDEFWKQSPELFWAYRFSYYEKQRIEREKTNHDAWLQGVYFYEALSVSLSNAFGGSKLSYRTSPIDLNQEENEKVSNQSNLEISLKNRVSKVQELFRSGKCKTN